MMRIPIAARGAVIAAVAALTLAGCTSTTAPPAAGQAAGTSATAAPPADAPALQQAYVKAVHDVLPSVVEITTTQGLGSGVIFDGQGHIVTNAHVVGKATSFQVRLAGNPKPIPATLMGAYPPPTTWP